MERKHIAVLMGGPSLERTISLWSGREVIEALSRAGHVVIPLVLEMSRRVRRGRAITNTATLESFLAAPTLPLGAVALEAEEDILDTASRLRRGLAEAVILTLHGDPGEDGSLQSFFEWSGVPYTGPGPAASCMALDKVLCKSLLDAAGLPTAPWVMIDRSASDDDGSKALALGMKSVGLPAVLKAHDQGSSFGVQRVTTEDEAQRALESIRSVSSKIVWEAFIAGREMSVPVLGGGATATRMLPVVEIVPKKESWFDTASKYDDDGADEIVPAPIDDALATTLSQLALRVHQLIGAEGLTRSDFIVGPDGPVILEVNTIPGMTQASLVPKAAKAAGLGFLGLIEDLIASALTRGTPRDEVARNNEAGAADV